MRTMVNYASNVLPMTVTMEQALRRMCCYTEGQTMEITNDRIIKLMSTYKEQYGELPETWKEYLLKAKYAVALADVYDMDDLTTLSAAELRDLYVQEYISDEKTVTYMNPNGTVSKKRVA